MAEFNKQEFAERLKRIRKDKGLSQENLARAINKDTATISRFESGKLIPDAEQITLMCNELEINESDLFNSSSRPISNKESINPFGVNTLYAYYYGYFLLLKSMENVNSNWIYYKKQVIVPLKWLIIKQIEYISVAI